MVERHSHHDVERYKTVIKEAFTKHYEEGSDVWSNDASLVDATKIAFDTAFKRLNRRLHLLDIGCGNGRHLMSLPNLASYTGIDLFHHENWESYYGTKPFEVKFIQDDFLAWAMRQTQKFDLIVDNGCFHHQHPDEHFDYLQQISECLQSDGLFSVVVWGEVFREGNIDDYGRYHCYFSPESIVQLIESTPLEVLRVIESKALIGKSQLQVIALKK